MAFSLRGDRFAQASGPPAIHTQSQEPWAQGMNQVKPACDGSHMLSRWQATTDFKKTVRVSQQKLRTLT